MVDANKSGGADVPASTEKPETKPHEGLVAEFIHSAAYAAVQAPLSGLTQIVDQLSGKNFLPNVQFISAPDKGQGTADWVSQQVGGAVGMLVPFLAVRGSLRGVLGDTLKGTDTAATLGMSMREAGLTGFAYSALLQPTDLNNNQNFWVARGLSGVSGAATFMTLTGASAGLGKLAETAPLARSGFAPLIANPISAGILSGIPAGLVSAEGSSLTTQGRLATGQELGNSIAGMSLVGGLFGANETVKARFTEGKPVPAYLGGKANEFIKAKVTDGQPIGSYLGDKLGGAWTPRPAGTPAFASGDSVGPDGQVEHNVAPAPEVVVGDPAIAPKAPGEGSVAEVASTPADAPKPETTSDSTAKPGDTPAPKRTIKIPQVDVDRKVDLHNGIILLNDAGKNTASDAERTAFSNYAADEGQGLADHLRLVADQLKNPDNAHSVIDSAYAIPEGRQLLESATSDSATDADRQAFEDFVRTRGQVQAVRDDLTATAEDVQNTPEARALLEKAYAPRVVDIEVEPGQQAAFTKGLQILKDPDGIDSAKLAEFAKGPPDGHGPAMEGPMSEAADQLGMGTDAQLAILEAYHGPAMTKGIELLRAQPLDVAKLNAFADGAGKALRVEMAGAAAELGLPGDAQNSIYEAYKGKQAWVDVEDRPIGRYPIPPEKEESFRTGIEMAKMVADRDTAAENPDYMKMMRAYLHSPDHQDLAGPLKDYFALAEAPADDASQTPEQRELIQRAQAVVREATMGPKNFVLSDKPNVQIATDEGATEQETEYRVNQIKNFNTLTEQLTAAPASDLSEARGAVFDWLNRNPEMHDVAEEYAKQSSNSRVVAALDSYLGTDNLQPFIDAQANYEALHKSITPEVINRINQSGDDLFWELAPKDPETPTMWGGDEHASKAKDALKISIPKDEVDPETGAKIKLSPEQKTVTAQFINHPDGLSTITDEPDGTRTMNFEDGSVIRQLPNGQEIHVDPDGSFHANLTNGNSIDEFSEEHGGNVLRQIVENGTTTYLNRDGTVIVRDPQGQVATTADAEAEAEQEQAAVEEHQRAENEDPRESTERRSSEQEQADRAAAAQANLDGLAAKLEPESTATYNEKVNAAIDLKDHFGNMSDVQFFDWLDFANGTHTDSSGRTLPNWQSLRMANIQVLFNPEIQNMLYGGSTEAERNSAEGMASAEAGRTLLRNFLDAPEARNNDLEFSSWLTSENRLPPDQWPDWLLNDVRVRFKLKGGGYPDSVPEDVQEYLNDNPEKLVKKANSKYPPKAFSLRADDSPGRLASLANIVEYVPADLQEPLLRLGAEDGRALNDVLRTFLPPKEAKDALPTEYTKLLELTVPQANDIYTVKLMLSAIKESSFAARNPDEAERAQLLKQNREIALEAASQLSPDNPTDQQEVHRLVSGLLDGTFRAPDSRGGGGRSGGGDRSGGDRSGGRDRGGDRGGDRGRGGERNRDQSGGDDGAKKKGPIVDVNGAPLPPPLPAEEDNAEAPSPLPPPPGAGKLGEAIDEEADAAAAEEAARPAPPPPLDEDNQPEFPLPGTNEPEDDFANWLEERDNLPGDMDLYDQP